ncbi:MAG TPA: NAD-dependent epimerase/dehydratase family protein [Gammaproteobacteria bacterium]
MLVTGATGFVGRALCRHLRTGWKVRALVRPSAAALGVEDVEVLQRDSLAGVSGDDAAFLDVDAVVHLAGRAHAPGMSAAEREAVFSADARATESLAEAAARAGVRRLVFVSTAKVLGEESRDGEAFTHDSLPAPGDEYARYKLAAEDSVRDCAEKLGMEWVIVRPVLVYGEGVKGNLAALLRWLDAGYPLPFGGLKNRRSLIALEDLNDLLACCIDHPAAAGQRLLASGNEAISTAAICSSLAEGLGRPARIVPLPSAFWTLVRMLPFTAKKASRLAGSFLVDNARTRALTGWSPRTPVREGLVALGRFHRAETGSGARRDLE